MMASVWISNWSQDASSTNGPRDAVQRNWRLMVYALIGVAQGTLASVTEHVITEGSQLLLKTASTFRQRSSHSKGWRMLVTLRCVLAGLVCLLSELKTSLRHFLFFFLVVLSAGVSIWVGTLILGLRGLHASRSLHEHILYRVVRAPMSFFDTTPLGRILNRSVD